MIFLIEVKLYFRQCDGHRTNHLQRQRGSRSLLGRVDGNDPNDKQGLACQLFLLEWFASEQTKCTFCNAFLENGEPKGQQ